MTKLLSLGTTASQWTRTSLIKPPNFTHLVCKSPSTSSFSSASRSSRLPLPLSCSYSHSRLFASSSSSSSSSSSPNKDDNDVFKKYSQPQHDSAANPELVGWWVGVSEEGKVPYNHLIHISADQGRYMAKSFSPWQLAAAKNGTPVFEIYVTTGLNGYYKEQAIYLKHRTACQDFLGSAEGLNAKVSVIPLTAAGSKNFWPQWGKTITRFAASNGKDTDTDEHKNFLAKFGMDKEVERDEATEIAVDSLGEKTAISMGFAIGDIVEKAAALDKDLLRVPAVLERKGFFSFCLTLEEDKDLNVSGDHSLEVYRTTDHSLFDAIDCMGRGIQRKKTDRGSDQSIPLLVCRAKNQQPILSRLTTFNRIDVPASSDPLNGLYIGSNGYLATEVFQIRRMFGPWHEAGGIKDVSELELCDYVEAVNLTGDSDMQVAFRAKVGEKYKLSPGILEEKFEVVARYKGEGRLPGFQNSKWVDVQVMILGGKHRRDGYAIGVLYSASEYYFLKIFKELKLQSFQESH